MTVLASGADERYGHWLLNLVGSVQTNANEFERIVLYDLGLNPFQRRLAQSLRGAELRPVPEFVPHWRHGRTWKLWIWRHLEADEILWLDAGVSVLRSLADPREQIRKLGYFIVHNGHPIRPTVPSDYWAAFGVTDALADGPGIAAGIFGFKRSSDVFDRVIVPAYEDALAGLTLGASPGEIQKYTQGMERTSALILRDCPQFRHEQTILNLRFFSVFPNAVPNDVYKYGGWLSPHDHPEQLIWSHRRRGDFTYLPRIRYRVPLAPVWKAWGLWFRWAWWAKHHSWLFRPSTYIRKAKRIATAPFAR